MPDPKIPDFTSDPSGWLKGHLKKYGIIKDYDDPQTLDELAQHAQQAEQDRKKAEADKAAGDKAAKDVLDKNAANSSQSDQGFDQADELMKKRAKVRKYTGGGSGATAQDAEKALRQ